MQFNDVLRMTLDTLTEHVPTSADWVPLAVAGGVVAFALVMLTRGARLAPGMLAVLFAGVGALAGSFVAAQFHTAPLISMVIGGLGCAVLALVFFKLWLALLIAMCFVVIGNGVYYGQVLDTHVANFTTSNFDPQLNLVTLPKAGDPAAVVQPTAEAELVALWDHLKASVPNVEISLSAITLATLLAGLVFGLLLPVTARALAASTAGVLLLIGGTLSLLEAAGQQAAIQWLSAQGSWMWIAVGVIWGASLLYNWLTCRPRAVATRPAVVEGQPAAV